MDAGSMGRRSDNLRPESVESPSLDEKSVQEIFSKHYARKSRDRYPTFSNKPKRLVLKKKPLVLPKVLRGELSQSSASYHFVAGESVERAETYLDEDSSPRLFFQTKNDASHYGSDVLKTTGARGPGGLNSMQKSGAQSLVPMLNTPVDAPMEQLMQQRQMQRKFTKKRGTYKDFGLGHAMPEYHVQAKIHQGRRSCVDLVDEHKMNTFAHELEGTVNQQGEILDKLNDEMNETRKDITKAYFLMLKQRDRDFTMMR